MSMSNSKDALQNYFEDLLGSVEQKTDSPDEQTMSFAASDLPDESGDRNAQNVDKGEGDEKSAPIKKYDSADKSVLSEKAALAEKKVVNENVNAAKARDTTIKETRSVSERPTVSHPALPSEYLPRERGNPTPRERLASEMAAYNADSSSLPQASVSFPEPQIDDYEALKEEQKRKLQTLLSQQTLQVDAQTVSKPEEPKTKVQEQLDTPVVSTVVSEQLKTDALSTVDTNTSTVAETDIQAYTVFEDDDGSFHNELASEIEWAENGRPQWAQERFDALLFDVGGLTLAVPLITLGQIVPLNKETLTPIFGQSDWFMGIQPTNIGKLRVVNTAMFVMPEKYNASFLDGAEFVISLDGCPWALAVNKVNQPVSLDPAEIKWRSERSKRPWLAGTVKSAMCALLDVPKMAHLLNQSDKQMSQGH